MVAKTKYRSDMPDQVLAMMTEGKSITQVAAALGLNRETLHKWEKDSRKAAMGKALKRGRVLAEAYWEEMGRLGIQGKLPKFNATAYIYTMKCRFKGQWMEDNISHKIDITAKHSNASDAELNKLIEKHLNKNVIDLNELAHGFVEVNERAKA